MYDNQAFNSKPEIAYYVWLKDNNMDFEYQPGTSFEYEFCGKTHNYFPDFRIGNSFVELKGNQFLTEDGKWKNPFRAPDWTDEQYANEGAKYEAKRQCAIANGVKILYSNDYQKYLDYVSGKYGKDWLDSFRNN